MTGRRPLGEILTLRRDPTEPDPAKTYRQIGVRGFGRGIFEYPAVAGSDLGKLRYYDLAPDRLVVSNIKGWEGAVDVTPHDESGRVASNRFLTYAAADQDCVDLRYVAHWLLSDEGLEALGRASPGSADRNRTLSIRSFEHIRAPLPNIQEQRRIAAHLDAVASKTATAATARNDASTLTTAVLDELVAGWDTRSALGDVAGVSRGVVPTLEAGGEGIIGQAAVRWSGVDHRQLKGTNPLWAATVPPQRRTFPGDVLLNSTGEGTIGRACVVTDDSAGMLTDSKVLTVRCGPALINEFLTAFLRSSKGQEAIDDIKGANTTKQTELGVARALRLQVPVPSLDRQRYVVDRWRTASRILEEARTSEARRQHLVAGLLPAARNEVFSALR